MLISVIIPVYNVAPYLRRCIDSVLAQTLRSFELILVDDGSSDGSADICDAYATDGGASAPGSTDAVSVRVVHQPNAGVSAARNRGIAEARGQYIAFIDADDWVEPAFLQAFADELRRHDERVDMVVQGYIDHEGQPVRMNQGYYCREEFGLPLIEAKEKLILSYVWNKFYKLSIIREHGLAFDKTVPIGEDYVFNMLYVVYSNRISFVPFVYYHYINSGDKSFSGSSFRKRLEALNPILERMEFLSKTERHQLLSKEFQLSTYAICVTYHEKTPRGERLRLLEQTRRRGKDNSELRLGTYSLVYRLTAYVVQWFPIGISDAIFMTTSLLRHLARRMKHS